MFLTVRWLVPRSVQLLPYRSRRGGEQPVLQVPIAAVYDPGKGTGVWVIAGAPTKVTWRPVEILSLADDSARVSGDLKVGEQIVALGAHLLQDGEQVRLASQSDVSVAGSRP